MRKTKHKFSQNVGKIKSQKNMPPKGDVITMDDRHSDGEEQRVFEPVRAQKVPVKATKQQVSGRPVGGVSKQKMQGIDQLDELMHKSTKLQMKAQKEALGLSNDSGNGNGHKRPRQPKQQRVGSNVKVESSEKEPVKKSPIKEVEVEKTKQRKDNGAFEVIMKNKIKAEQVEKQKEKDKKERKAKRESVRKQIKAAKNKPKPPMVFTGVSEEEVPKPKRALQRTPPRVQKTSPDKDVGFGMMGGGMVSRDDPAPVKAVGGPVKRSPPRKASPPPMIETVEPSATPYDYSNANFIERKDKITRSPVSNRSPKLLQENSPKLRLDKQHSIPVPSNPMKVSNELTAPTDYQGEPSYQAYSPQKQPPIPFMHSNSYSQR